MELEEKQRLFASLDKIERGIYGDKDNKQEGLIDKVDRHDKVLRPIEFFASRPKLTTAFFLGCVELFLELNKVGLITGLISLLK